MGAIHFSIDPGLARRLAAELPIEVFVETGTFEGASVDAVSPLFEETHTIELSDELFARAEEKFAEQSEVNVHHGRSADVLEEIAPSLKSRPTLFWLDAHWSDEPGAAGEGENCPLLDELESIEELGPDSVVMIDDARLFLAPPPPPADPDEWPNLGQVLTALSSLSENHEPMVIDDVIVFFPAKIRDAVREYAREEGSEWFAELGRARETNTRLDRLESQLDTIPRETAAALESGLQQRFAAIDSTLGELGVGTTALGRRLGDLSEQLESLQRGMGGLDETSRATRDALSDTRAAIAEENQAVVQRLEAIGAELDDRLEALATQLRQVRDQRPLIEEIQRKLGKVQEQGPRIEMVLRRLDEMDDRISDQRPHIEEVQRLLTIMSEPVIARERRRQRIKQVAAAPFALVAGVLAPVAPPFRWLWAQVRWAGGAVRQHAGVWLGRLRPEPKLGQLEHHPPTEMDIPKRYLNSKPPENPPSISIVTPSLNQASFLERTISSVVDQGYPRLEYFVQDGDSADGTRDVLERFDSRLDDWVMRPDDGQAHAINLGFERTQGDVMAYLNSDDLLLPGSLRFVGNYFEANPDVDVIYGHRVLIDERDREIGRWVLPKHSDSVLSWADYVPQETLYWRRRAWEAAGGQVDEDFRFALDWDLLLRMRDAGANIVRVPRFLGAFRVHDAQKTSAELEAAGASEMSRIRSREHSREVPAEEVHRELRGYLRRHVALHKLYRAGLIRY